MTKFETLLGKEALRKAKLDRTSPNMYIVEMNSAEMMAICGERTGRSTDRPGNRVEVLFRSETQKQISLSLLAFKPADRDLVFVRRVRFILRSYLLCHFLRACVKVNRELNSGGFEYLHFKNFTHAR